jgi:hypothetical protein
MISSTRAALTLIDQLLLQGVEQFCIAPGSRSAPLAMAAAEKKANITVHFDERGLGFFALGYGKAKKKPAVLITTSGSAVANLYPAVMESFLTSNGKWISLLTSVKNKSARLPQTPFSKQDAALSNSTALSKNLSTKRHRSTKALQLPWHIPLYKLLHKKKIQPKA